MIIIFKANCFLLSHFILPMVLPVIKIIIAFIANVYVFKFALMEVLLLLLLLLLYSSYIVTYSPIARQRLGNTFLRKQMLAIERPLLGNGSVNMPP
jgi:hypothetical protein